MNLSWRIIFILGSVALIRPLFSSLGILEVIGQPFASLSITFVISILWVIAVVWKKIPHPVLTLLSAGIVYGLFAIVISAVMSPIFTGELQGPLTHPLGIISVLITNAFWGGAVGILAAGGQKLTN